MVLIVKDLIRKNSGEGGIRTHGGVTPTPVFETGLFNRSSTSPELILHYLAKPTTFAFFSNGEICGDSTSKLPNAGSFATVSRL